MATSRVMTSSSSGNSDLALKSPLYPSPEAAALPNSASSGDPPKSLGSMSMEDLLRNICGDSSPLVAASPFAGSGEPGSVEAPAGAVKSAGIKTAEEVWREITAGRRLDISVGAVAVGSGCEGSDVGEMTLEDFLTKAGAVMDEDVRVPSGGFSVDSAVADRLGQPLTIETPVMGFGNGAELVVGGGGRGGRSRRRPLLDPEDKAALQRQKRMIKNRESAARSRERKQAYTTELESLVHQLEQENAQLHYHWDQKNKKRLKQLMEMVFPVKVMPPRKLRRTSSMNW